MFREIFPAFLAYVDRPGPSADYTTYTLMVLPNKGKYVKFVGFLNFLVSFWLVYDNFSTKTF